MNSPCAKLKINQSIYAVIEAQRDKKIVKVVFLTFYVFGPNNLISQCYQLENYMPTNKVGD